MTLLTRDSHVLQSLHFIAVIKSRLKSYLSPTLNFFYLTMKQEKD